MINVWSTILFGLCGIACGQFTFEAPKQVPKATPNQRLFKTSFKFKNTGQTTLTISKIKSSCACLPSDLKKRIYKPGESGEIKAELTFGNRKGKLVKNIYVSVIGDKTKLYTLQIGSIIPEFARLTPRFIKWESGDEPKAKRIRMTIIHTDPINVLKVDSSNPKWTTKLKVVKKGREFEIWLTPPTTKEASRTALSIEMDYPIKNHLIFRAIGRVTQPPPPKLKAKGWLEKMLEEDGVK